MDHVLSMFKKTLIFTLPFLSFHTNLYSQSLEQKIEQCAEIEVSLIRLQCFDRLAKEPNTQTSNQPRKKSTLFSRLTNKDDQATIKEDENQSKSGDLSSTEVQENNSSSADDSFGLINRDSVNSIESKIIGDFSGWDGATTFRLENGQIWKQSASAVFRVQMYNPKVVIKKSIITDTYQLSVEGYNSTVRVKRIE